MRIGARASLLAVVALAGCGGQARVVVGAQSALSYVLSCQKEDGGFGPQDQPYVGPTWTDHAVSVISQFGVPMPRGGACARALDRSLEEEFPDTTRPSWVTLAVASARSRLDERPDPAEVESLRARQRADGGWGEPGRISTLTETYRAVMTLASWNAAPLDREAAAQFIVDRLHRDGHFDDVPRVVVRPDTTTAAPIAPSDPESSPPPTGGTYRRNGAEADTAGARPPTRPEATASATPAEHIWLTACAVRALVVLGYETPWRDVVVAWIRSCQQEDGGFSWRPDPDVAGRSDIWYTWLGVSALRALGAMPRDSKGVAQFVNACQNADGGFGDKPGWLSRLEATDYAVQTLGALTGDLAGAIESKLVPIARRETPRAWQRFGIYSVYPGPTLAERTDRAGRWWPGLPEYPLDVPPERASNLLVTPGVVIGDTSLAWLLWSIRLPSVRLILPHGRSTWRELSLALPIQQEPSVVSALRDAERLPEGTPLDQDSLFRLVAPLLERGGVVCERLDGDDEMAARLAMDGIIARAVPTITVAGALSDGTDLVRRAPWLERAIGRIPLSVAPAAKDSVPRDRARLLWFGRQGTPIDLRFALLTCRSACVVRAAESPTGYALYGCPETTEAFLGRVAAWRWQGGPKGRR